MIRGILSGLGAAIVIALAIALLRAFDWDIGELLTWAWEHTMELINYIADFFSGNKTFQKVVSS